MLTKLYEDHPLAGSYPLLTPVELNDLAADIRENGLNRKIVIYQDMILDGRNRYRACLKAGVMPEFEELPFGKHPLKYVHSENGKRRNLTRSQIALAIVQSIAIWNALPPELRSEKHDMEVAEMEFSRATLSKARTVMENAPKEVIEKIQQGDLSVEKAYVELPKEKRTPQPPPPKAMMPKEALAVIGKNCGEKFAKAIEEGVIVLQVNEIKALATRPKEEMAQLGRFIIANRCRLHIADKAISTMATPNHPVSVLINQCIANNTKMVYEMNGHRITVEYIGK